MNVTGPWKEFITARGFSTTERVELAAGMHGGHLSPYLNGKLDPYGMRHRRIGALARVLDAPADEIRATMRAEAEFRHQQAAQTA